MENEMITYVTMIAKNLIDDEEACNEFDRLCDTYGTKNCCKWLCEKGMEVFENAKS